MRSSLPRGLRQLELGPRDLVGHRGPHLRQPSLRLLDEGSSFTRVESDEDVPSRDHVPLVHVHRLHDARNGGPQLGTRGCGDPPRDDQRAPNIGRASGSSSDFGATGPSHDPPRGRGQDDHHRPADNESSPTDGACIGRGHETRSIRGLSRSQRPTLATGAPSTATTSAVKS